MKKLFFLSIVIILSSCSTRYHKKAYNGGYSEIQFDSNLFQVSFKGNSRTSMEKTVDYALLRSSQVTLKNGYNYFVIIKGNQYVKKYNHLHFDYFGPYSHTIHKPRVTFKIRCYTDKPEKFSYDALLTGNSIKEKYNIHNQ